MQGLILHQDRRPPLRKGTLVLPIRSWEQSKLPLRIVRTTERSRGRRGDFVTLVALPPEQLVAVVVGEAPSSVETLQFSPLNALPPEDRTLLAEWFESTSQSAPAVSAAAMTWVVRLALGEPITRSEVKWTKDLRLLLDKKSRRGRSKAGRGDD